MSLSNSKIIRQVAAVSGGPFPVSPAGLLSFLNAHQLGKNGRPISKNFVLVKFTSPALCAYFVVIGMTENVG